MLRLYDILYANLSNIEHCQAREEVLIAMCLALKPLGQLYLSFPTESSVRFPSRTGTLNYFDDDSHKQAPPIIDDVIRVLREQGMNITFFRRQYRPLLPFVIGIVLEPFSFLFKKVAPLGSTWALYGFETVIWAEKVS